MYHLKRAGLTDNPQRGKWQITDRGQQVLVDAPATLNIKYLKRFPSYANPLGQGKTECDEPNEVISEKRTPDEAIYSAYQDIRAVLAEDLLDQVLACSPRFFERLVIDLLIAMGYGGALPDAGQHLGKSGDGGIDGVINEDKLGLDVICIQAKRWKDTVGRPQVQAFAGSMEGFRAKKGVLITTSTFSAEARQFVQKIERKIVLIDGQQLAQLMIDYNIGVAADRTYILKKIDSDYFIEDGD